MEALVRHPLWACTPPSCAGVLPLDPERLVSDPFQVCFIDQTNVFGPRSQKSYFMVSERVAPFACFLGLIQEVPPHPLD